MLSTHSEIINIFLIQIRLHQSLLLQVVLDVSLEHVHYVVVVFFRSGFQIRGPVINVPVIGHVVDEMVVLGHLLGGHFVEELGNERGQEDVVLQHAPLPGLIDQASFLCLQRFVLFVLVLGEGQSVLVVTVYAWNGVGIGGVRGFGRQGPEIGDGL